MINLNVAGLKANKIEDNKYVEYIEIEKLDNSDIVTYRRPERRTVSALIKKSYDAPIKEYFQKSRGKKVKTSVSVYGRYSTKYEYRVTDENTGESTAPKVASTRWVSHWRETHRVLSHPCLRRDAIGSAYQYSLANEHIKAGKILEANYIQHAGLDIDYTYRFYLPQLPYYYCFAIYSNCKFVEKESVSKSKKKSGQSKVSAVVALEHEGPYVIQLLNTRVGSSSEQWTINGHIDSFTADTLEGALDGICKKAVSYSIECAAKYAEVYIV